MNWKNHSSNFIPHKMWVITINFILILVGIEPSFCNHIKAFDDTILFNLEWSGNLDKIFDEVHNDNSLLMMTSENEKYLCILPTNIKTDKSAIDDYNGPSPVDLLKPLFYQVPCSYKVDQYWTYELCHGRHIRQYHEESTFQGIHIQEFLLGKYDLEKLDSKEFAEKQITEEIKTIKIGDTDLPYIEINMTMGTLCDVNTKYRFTRVLYVCSEDVKQEFVSIKEAPSCEYEAIVSTSLLCFHPHYRVKSSPRNDIQCHALDGAQIKPKQLAVFDKENSEIHEDQDEMIDIPNGILSPPPPPPPPMATMGSETGSQTPHDPKLVDDFLSGSYCLQGGSGWWKYEFCFGKKVEQFHEEYAKQKQTVLLGLWNEVGHLEWLKKNPHKKPKPGLTAKYISHYYGGGTICDLTQKPRYTEVRLKCKETVEKIDTVSLYLLEPKPCEYILMVESSFICPLLDSVNEYGIFDK